MAQQVVVVRMATSLQPGTADRNQFMDLFCATTGVSGAEIHLSPVFPMFFREFPEFLDPPARSQNRCGAKNHGSSD
jgi:hypothetical protein